MKIWLPDSFYRAKPFLLVLLGGCLLFLSNSIYLSILAFFCLGYGIWILVVRLMWSTTGVLKTRVGSTMGNEPRARVVDVTHKKSHK